MRESRIQTRHVHSSLFIASRVLFLAAFIPQWQNLRVVMFTFLSLCAFHQFALYVRRVKHVDERTFYQRPSLRRIHQSTGPVGKLLAAVNVYFWEFPSHWHPINLLHWLEEALVISIIGEYLKVTTAMRMQLQFIWNSERMMLYMKHIKRNTSEPGRYRIFCTASLIFQKLLCVKSSDCSRLTALPQAPSFVVFFLYVALGRKSLHLLQSDPRGRAYHMDSFFRHHAREKGIDTGCSVKPTAFGIEMAPYFSLGISRKIPVEEAEDPECRERLRLELMKATPNLADDQMLSGEPIDYESVYCLSYRHLEDKGSEGLYLSNTFLLAAQLAKAKGYRYFRVWMDKLLRQHSGRNTGRWAFYGLLPYAYFSVIAVRNISEDEEERMWLLAEERLAYGNMGLRVIDAKSNPLSYEVIPGLRHGPEGSILIYLRYLKTEESTPEKTYHLEDQQRFKELADRHGTTDDEQEIYEGLCLDFGLRPITTAGKTNCVWYNTILDVESYSALRKREFEADKIEFRKVENVEFDGYREWFKWKDDRRKLSNRTPSEGEFEDSLLYQSKLLTAYDCKTTTYSVILLIHRGDTGVLHDKATCICLNYVNQENQNDGFRILECIRIRLRYDRSPPDESYLHAATRLMQLNEDETVQIVEIDPRQLPFL